jgi:hypothetical protein
MGSRLALWEGIQLPILISPTVKTRRSATRPELDRCSFEILTQAEQILGLWVAAADSLYRHDLDACAPNTYSSVWHLAVISKDCCISAKLIVLPTASPSYPVARLKTLAYPL